jgi:hypothetical protein
MMHARTVARAYPHAHARACAHAHAEASTRASDSCHGDSRLGLGAPPLTPLRARACVSHRYATENGALRMLTKRQEKAVVAAAAAAAAGAAAAGPGGPGTASETASKSKRRSTSFGKARWVRARVQLLQLCCRPVVVLAWSVLSAFDRWKLWRAARFQAQRRRQRRRRQALAN